jgi:Helix-turn-helix domain
VADEFVKAKFEWLDEIVRDPAITPFTFCVAYVLSNHFNRLKNGYAWPAHKTLAEQLGCHRDSVKKAIRNLIEAKYLYCTEERGRGHSNWYRMKNGDSDAPLFGGKQSSSNKRGTAVPQKGDGHPAKGVPPGPQNPLNETTDETIERARGGGDAHSADRGQSFKQADVRQDSKNQSEQNKPTKPKEQQPKKPKARGDRGRYEVEIANIIGWECLASLSDLQVAELCEMQRMQVAGLDRVLANIKALWEAKATAA